MLKDLIVYDQKIMSNIKKKYCLIYNNVKPSKTGASMHNLMIDNETEGPDLITSLITLKVILEDIDKTSIVKDLEINNKLTELEKEKK